MAVSKSNILLPQRLNDLIRKTAMAGGFHMNVLTMAEIKAALRTLLARYNAEYAIVFGSYARGDVTPDSDLDVIIVGGKNFVPRKLIQEATSMAWQFRTFRRIPSRFTPHLHQNQPHGALTTSPRSGRYCRSDLGLFCVALYHIFCILPFKSKIFR